MAGEDLGLDLLEASELDEAELPLGVGIAADDAEAEVGEALLLRRR